MKNQTYVPLRVNSNYSIFSGISTLEELVKEAVSKKLNCLALTDISNLSGMLEFNSICKSKNINPIFGVEFTFEYYSLVCIIKTYAGYSNLIELININSTRKLTIDDIKTHSNDIVVIFSFNEKPSLVSYFYSDMATLKEVFKDDLYIELNLFDEVKSNIENSIKASEKLGLKKLASNKVFYAKSTDYELKEVLEGIRTNTAHSKLDFNYKENYLKSYEEMQEKYSDFQDTLVNTLEVAEKCNVKFPSYTLKELPTLSKNPYETLKNLAEEGLKNLSIALSEEIKVRFDYELNAIAEKNLANLFLIITNYVNFSRNVMGVRNKKITSSSITCYCLGISDIFIESQSSKFFIDKDILDYPIFDISFSNPDLLQMYLTDTYGSENIASICSFKKADSYYILKKVSDFFEFADLRIFDNLISVFPKKDLKDIVELNLIHDSLAAKVIDFSIKIQSKLLYKDIDKCSFFLSKNPIKNIIPIEVFKGRNMSQYNDLYVMRSGFLPLYIH